MKLIRGTRKNKESKTHGELPANTRLCQIYAASGKHSFTSPAGYLSDAKQITPQKKGNLRGWGDERDRGRTPEVKHSLSAANWLSPANSRVFYVLFIPLATEHKRASVICATLINRSTSSAKSKTRGHSRHPRRFLNRRGRLGVAPAVACCRKQQEAWRVAEEGHCGGRRTVRRVTAKGGGYKRNNILLPISVLILFLCDYTASSLTELPYSLFYEFKRGKKLVFLNAGIFYAIRL